MKKIFFFLYMLTFLSCSLDDDGTQINPPNFNVLGLWDLSEVIINPPQDLNEDGTSSENLFDELECLSGELLIDGDLQWSLEQTNLSVTTITGGQFNIQCNGMVSANGTWFSDENEVIFEDNPEFSALQIENGRLILNTNEDLPGFQRFVYVLRQ